MRIVECAPGRVEIREEQIAIDQPVDAVVTNGLLHALKRVARDREQLVPTATAHRRDRRLRAVALWACRDEERDASGRAAAHFDLAAQTEARRLRALYGDARVAICGDRERGKAGLRTSLEHDDLIVALDHAMRIVRGARRAHAKLPMPEHALERHGDARRRIRAILDRDRVHGTREVGVAAVGREQRTAHE